MMTRLLSVCVLSLMAVAPAFAQKKGCEELAAEIAAKLDAKGVKGYKLDIVATGEVGDKQVVGSCEAGAKKIIYERDAASKASNAK
jgi:pentose-5-phosphate-3-epimerase